MSSKKKTKPATVEELYTGYLLSPTPSALPRNTRAWKRCFFVLSKMSEGSYQLTYHENHERRDKPLRVIDISKITLLFIGPETHQKWNWIQKNFKCSPSSVLFLKVEEDTAKHSRDHFLIGENSDDVNGWFNVLFGVMKTQQSRSTLQETKFRSASEPVRLDFLKHNDRRSAPELMLTYPSLYRNDELSEPPVPVMRKIPVFENTDKKDRKQDESPENSSVYMSMASVRSVTDTSEDSLLDHVTKAFNDMKTLQTSTESDGQNEDHRGSCASTELDISETHTYVEKEICVSQNDLILTQDKGKPSVSQWHQMQDSRRDQTLSQEAVEGIQKCLKRLSKEEAKLLVQRFPGLNPNPVYHSEDRIQSLMRILSSQSKY